MIGRRCHCADSIVSNRESASHNGLKKTIAITSVVDALKENKLGGVEGLFRVQTCSQVLHGHVGMTDNFATFQCLGSGVVGCLRVGERSSDEVGHLNGDVEGCLRFQVC